MIANLPLLEGWKLQHPHQPQRWLPARVPGCVHTDLHRAGLIPDPFFGRNELELGWMEERDWVYRLDFRVPAPLRRAPELDIVFEGLDTVATVRLNGEALLASDNMFHAHRVPVRTRLRSGLNRLEVHFGSALAYIRSRRTYTPPKEFNDPIGRSACLRKQPSQFGWDWGPRLVTAGLWRGVRLEAWAGNRLDAVRVDQRHGADGTVELNLLPQLARPEAFGRWKTRLLLGREVVAGADGTTLRVATPQLWWPRGQGAQPLYQLVVEHELDGRPAGRWERRIGLRTIELDLDPDGFQPAPAERPLTRFGLRVNGRLVFAQGANWIPAHSFVHGLGRDDYAPLLQAAADAHFNCVRVWGGGIYEHDAFYDLCDELGLLAWQDFMFACTTYPGDADFVASVRREAEENVRRLRHHACLALWCGNNEIAVLNREALRSPEHGEPYRAVFLETLPAVVRAEDPATAYIHSSPAVPVDGQPASVLPSEDVHDWAVWHSRRPPEHYVRTQPRFASEFGMQSYPSPEVAATFCREEDLNVFSPVFDNHQKNNAGNQIILDYLSRAYRFPRDYDGLSYLSQLNQAECMRVGVEHFRFLSPRCLGALYWQLNDCWPVASWSSLEFGGAWKALHHYARRFLAPIRVGVQHLGHETKKLGNRLHSTLGPVEFRGINAQPKPAAGVLRWELLDLATGRVRRRGRLAATLPSGEGVLLGTEDFTADLDRHGRDRLILRVRWTDRGGAVHSDSTTFFTAPRALALPDKPIRARWQRQSPRSAHLIVDSPVFHHAVRLDLPATSIWWSDNWFDLFPGEPRTIEVRWPRPPRPATLQRLTARSLVHA